jgi:PAS domain S-box-containing protein
MSGAGATSGLTPGAKPALGADFIASGELTIQALLEASVQGILGVRADGSITLANPALERLFGYEPGELIGRNLEVLLPIDLRDAHQGHRSQFFVTPKPRPMGSGLELFGLRKDGRRFPIEVSLSYVSCPSGPLAVAFVTDISDRKRIESQLTESEARFRLMADAAPVLIKVADPDGGGSYFNKGWLDFTGRSLEEEAGAGWLARIHPEDRAQCQSLLSYAFDERRSIRVEYRLLRADGQYRWLLDSGVPRFDPQGLFLGYISCAVDITERKETEEQILGVLREKDSLLRSNDELKQLVYAVAHDLREPLRGLNSYAQLLERRYASVLDQNGVEFVDFIVRGAQRMSTLMDAVMEYGNLAGDTSPLRRVNAREVLDETLNDLSGRIKETRAAIECDVDATVWAHPVQLSRVFQNLIANALKYSNHSAPHVHISCSVRGSDCVFAIRDQGVGIAPEFQEQIFGMFKRLDHTGGGMGMGLTFCRKIIERHGGRIWVESQPREGSTFYFTLARVTNDGQ